MTATDVLQTCLAAEHAAVYAYGVLGGVLTEVPDSSRWHALARRCYDAHRLRRDSLSATLERQGEDPVAAAAAYELGFAIDGASACRRLARQTESRTAAVYAYAVAGTTGDLRALAIDRLTECALNESAWGAPLDAFPGLAEA